MRVPKIFTNDKHKDNENTQHKDDDKHKHRAISSKPKLTSSWPRQGWKHDISAMTVFFSSVFVHPWEREIRMANWRLYGRATLDSCPLNGLSAGACLGSTTVSF